MNEILDIIQEVMRFASDKNGGNVYYLCTDLESRFKFVDHCRVYACGMGVETIGHRRLSLRLPKYQIEALPLSCRNVKRKQGFLTIAPSLFVIDPESSEPDIWKQVKEEAAIAAAKNSRIRYRIFHLAEKSC